MDNGIIQTQPDIKIRYNYGLKIYYLILIFICFVGFSFFVIMLLNDPSAIELILGAGVIGYIIWLAIKQGFHKLIIAPFRTVFMANAEGIWITELNTCIKWTDIKKIVIFNYMDKKHFGFELNNHAEFLNDSKRQDVIDIGATHDRQNMPFVTMYDALSPPAKEVIELLRTHYFVSVKDETSDS